MAAIKVIVIGASGPTGRSIVNGLLKSSNFEITAVSREASLSNKSNTELKQLGVRVVAGDVQGPEDALVRLLTGSDVVISAVAAPALLDQIPLADAAKKAGVGRFVPCAFGTAAPPRGVMHLLEQKELVLDHIKRIRLPYTVIDVGWWYQLTPPRVPSGRVDHGLVAPMGRIVGDGSVPSALTHLDDIGRYVARIVADPRTLNKLVFAHAEVLTQTQAFDAVERLSGETLERGCVSAAELEATIDKLVREASPDRMALWYAQYQYSWGIRGDNTPENAAYLGYLLTGELYPDFEPVGFERYVTDLLEGRATSPWASKGDL